MLEAVFRIRSNYFEHDSSRYRLAMTENTLARSLKHQNDKRFSLVVDLSPMDPYYLRRREVFASVGVPVQMEHEAVLQRRLEIRVGDDDYLHPSFLEAVRLFPEQQQNTRILTPNGYLFREGKLTAFDDKPDLVKTVQFVEEHDEVHRQAWITNSPCWIHVRHGMNSNCLVHPHDDNDFPLYWSGWKANIVELYCKSQIKTATAAGCDLEPTRGKVIYAKGSARARRTKKWRA